VRCTKYRAAMATPLSLIADGRSPSPSNSSAKASDSMPPRKVVVPTSTVNPFFPEVTREASTGRNLTAIANAKATRSVIYANSDGSKKVTITVDEYPTASNASSAYQELWRRPRLFRASSQFPRRISVRTPLSEL
jgi:hypothetical protein